MKKYLEILMVDDNPDDLSDLRNILEPLLESRETGFQIMEVNDPSAAGLQTRPDIIFMDVELQDLSGLDLASSLHQRYPESLVVLMSTYSHYSIEGYKTGAIRFLPKPFDEKMVHAVLDDAFFASLKSRKTIFHEELFDKPVPVHSILYVESGNRTTEVHFDKGQVVETHLTLREWKELTADSSFIQVYKSILVNPEWIEDLDGDSREVILKNKGRVPYSRHFKKDIQEQLQEYIWSTL